MNNFISVDYESRTVLLNLNYVTNIEIQDNHVKFYLSTDDKNPVEGDIEEKDKESLISQILDS